MTARAKVNGKNMIYVGWVEENIPDKEDLYGHRKCDLTNEYEVFE